MVLVGGDKIYLLCGIKLNISLFPRLEMVALCLHGMIIGTYWPSHYPSSGFSHDATVKDLICSGS